MPNTKVIDLTSENSIPENLRHARNAGVVGMIHEATTGSALTDDKAAARVYLAKDAGMRIGLYHNLVSGTPVAAQLQNFISTVKALGLEDNWLLAVKYDDPDVDAAALVEFLEGVEEKTHRSPVVYIPAVTAKELKDEKRKLSQYRLWLAQHDSVADVPVAWGTFFLWQWTEDGTVDGVSGPAGCSDSLFEDEALAKAWAGFDGKHDDALPEAAPIEQGEPESGTAPVEEQPAAPVVTEEGELDKPAEPADAGKPADETAPGATPYNK